MSRAAQINRQKIIAALETGRVVNIQQKTRNTLCGFRVINFDEKLGTITLYKDSAPNYINIIDIEDVDFEFLLYIGDSREPQVISGNPLQQHLHSIIGLKFYGHELINTHTILWVHVDNNQVVYVADSDWRAYVGEISQVEGIHIQVTS